MANLALHEFNFPKGGPLLCWDIFIDRMHRRMTLAQDAEDLRSYATEHNWKVQWDFTKMICEQEKVVVVTNLQAKIVFASSNMIEMNGYNAKDVVGKSPAIFQGPETELEYKKMVALKIKQEKSFQAIITNYKPYGTKYKCAIEGHPVFNLQGRLINYIAFEQAA